MAGLPALQLLRLLLTLPFGRLLLALAHVVAGLGATLGRGSGQNFLDPLSDRSSILGGRDLTTSEIFEPRDEGFHGTIGLDGQVSGDAFARDAFAIEPKLVRETQLALGVDLRPLDRTEAIDEGGHRTANEGNHLSREVVVHLVENTNRVLDALGVRSPVLLVHVHRVDQRVVHLGQSAHRFGELGRHDERSELRADNFCDEDAQSLEPIGKDVHQIGIQVRLERGHGLLLLAVGRQKEKVVNLCYSTILLIYIIAY